MDRVAARLTAPDKRGRMQPCHRVPNLEEVQKSSDPTLSLFIRNLSLSLVLSRNFRALLTSGSEDMPLTLTVGRKWPVGHSLVTPELINQLTMTVQEFLLYRIYRVGLRNLQESYATFTTIMIFFFFFKNQMSLG